MKISDIVRRKGTAVFTISPGDSVTTLLAALAEHNVGAIIVCEGDDVAGIVSERDVVRRLAERGKDVLDAPVSSIMTTNVVHASPGDSIDSVAETMTQRRIRHMPVMEDGRLVAVISIGDVVLNRISQLEQERGQLEQYVTG
jgi:CBS domain-containing protein